jgi:hypothetical protein
MERDRSVLRADIEPGQVPGDRRVQVDTPLVVELEQQDRGERLPMEPRSNAVSGATGLRADRSAYPNVAEATTPSRSVTTRERRGRPRTSRSSSTKPLRARDGTGQDDMVCR